MNISKKYNQIKENLKGFSKSLFGKTILAGSIIGLVLSFFSTGSLSSINPLLPFGFIITLFLGSISLLVGIFGLEKIQSQDPNVKSEILITSVKILGLGFVGFLINYCLNLNFSVINYLSILTLGTGVFGIQLFAQKNYETQMNEIENEDQNERQMEKLPLRVKLTEEEQELGLTNYLKR